MRTLTTLMVLITAVSGSSAGQQLPRDGIPLAFVSAVRQIEPPETPGAWVLQVISRGGLDGRGTGDLAISSDGALTLFKSATAASAPPGVLRSLRQFIQTTAPSQWTAGSRQGLCRLPRHAHRADTPAIRRSSSDADGFLGRDDQRECSGRCAADSRSRAVS